MIGPECALSRQEMEMHWWHIAPVGRTNPQAIVQSGARLEAFGVNMSLAHTSSNTYWLIDKIVPFFFYPPLSILINSTSFYVCVLRRQLLSLYS